MVRPFTVLLCLTLAAPVMAQQSSPSAIRTAHGEVTQFTYRLVIPAGSCLSLTGEQWLHPGGARLPWPIGVAPFVAAARLTVAQVTTIGKPTGLTLFVNRFAIATDSSQVVTYPDGLLLSGEVLTVQVYNPTATAQWAYVVMQVQR